MVKTKLNRDEIKRHLKELKVEDNAGKLGNCNPNEFYPPLSS